VTPSQPSVSRPRVKDWSLDRAQFRELPRPVRRDSVAYLFIYLLKKDDRLCGLVVRFSAYSRRGHGFDFRGYQIF
jgi:hypothetical protein